MAAPFFCPFVMHLLSSYWEVAARPVAWRRYHFVGACCFLMAVNLYHLEKRILSDDSLGNRFRRIAAEVSKNVHSDPETSVEVWVIHPSHHFDELCEALNLVSNNQVHHAGPQGKPPRNEIWLLIDGSNPEAPTFTWEFGERPARS
jgi:hypothetical protein